MAKPTISDLLPDCTTLDQAYPDGGDPGAIYLVAKSEDVQIAEKDWRWVTGVDVDHKIGLFKNVFEAELKRLNDHHAVWAWYVAFGLFRSEER